MTGRERVGWGLLAVVMLWLMAAAVLLNVSGCDVEPTPTPACDPCANATRIEELSRWMTPSTTATPGATDTPTPSRTPTASTTGSPTQTPTRTLTHTAEPTITATSVPYFFFPRSLPGQVAKPGSYVTLTLEYRGAPATVEVFLPEETDWYGRLYPEVKPNCEYGGELCWQGPELLVDVGVYLLRTWQPGEVVSIPVRLTLNDGEATEQRVNWTIQGGTPTMAPQWTRTPTRTPQPSAAVWGPGWTWITAEGSGPDLVFLVTGEGALKEGDILNFCDADHTCCSWIEVPTGPTWGWMKVTRLRDVEGCAEWRWVWVDHPIAVQRVEWRSQ